MNKVLHLFLMVFLCTYTINAQWSSISFYPDGSAYSVASFVIGDKAFVGGGNTAKKSFYMLDLNDDSWTRLDDIPGNVNRASPIHFVINGIGYVGAGADRFQGANSSFYAFDPETLEWTQKADFGGNFKHSAFYASAHGKGYVICGTDGSDPVADVWVYDPENDAWTQKADFPSGPVYWPTGFVINDRLFVGTGSVDGDEIKEFYEYDPENDAWIPRADFPGPLRTAATGFSLNGKGYIGGGVTEDFMGTHTDFYQYDPKSDSWRYVEELDFPIPNTAWSTAFTYGNTVYWGTGARLSFGIRPTPQWHKASIYSPPSIVDADISNTTCRGGHDGRIDVSVSGGEAPLTFLWSNGETSEDLIDLSEGDYQLEVTDARGTTISSPVYSVAADYFVDILNTENTSEACDQKDGAAIVEAMTNSDHLSYSWSHSDAVKGPRAENLAAGHYTVEVSNEHQCSSSVTIEVETTSGPAIKIDTVMEPDCKGRDKGLISLVVEGGHGNSAVLWQGPGNFTSSAETIDNLEAGSYQVRVTDERGCVETAEVMISEPEYPEGTVEILPASGKSTLGQIVVSDVQGGAPPYQYFLLDEAMSELERNLTGRFDSLPSGIYAVEVRDANSCGTLYSDLSIILTSDDQLDGPLNFSVYPNPASDHVRISAELINDTPVSLQVRDILGRVLIDQPVNERKINRQLDISSLKSGTYFVQLTTLKKKHMIALVK